MTFYKRSNKNEEKNIIKYLKKKTNPAKTKKYMKKRLRILIYLRRRILQLYKKKKRNLKIKYNFKL